MKTRNLSAHATRASGLLPNQPPNDGLLHHCCLRTRSPYGWLPALVMFCVGLLLLHGGSLTMSWSTVDGGGTSTNADGRFSVSGTAGQPDASALASSDGRFRLNGGFWQAELAGCGCTLGFALSGGNLLVSWPCELNGCILEYADELHDPPAATVWHPVTPSATGHSYIVPLTGTQRYFRLRSL